MKQNKKGFTLIELLAVIVILAIIALIATPIVLNMINQARKSAARSSSLGFVDSIEYYAGFNQAQDDSIQLGYSTAVPTVSEGNLICKATKSGNTVTWSEGTGVTLASGSTSCADFMAAVETKSKGKGPDSAEVKLDSAGKVLADSTFTYGSFTCTYDGNDVSCN